MSPRRKERAENVSKNILPALMANATSPMKLLADALGYGEQPQDDKPPQDRFSKRPTPRRPHANKPDKYRSFVWKGRGSYRAV